MSTVREAVMHSKALPTRRRLAKLKARVWVLGVAVAALALLASPAASSSATVGAPMYPDLRMLPPSGLTLVKYPINGVWHYALGFDAVTANVGPGPLEVDQVPQATPLSGLADLKQRVYEDPAGFTDIKLGAVAFSPTNYFEIPDAARYELWTRSAFIRAQAHQFTRGKPLLVKNDIRYCIHDGQQIDANIIDSKHPPRYTSCSSLVQGISPGWGDVQGYWEPNQQFDFGTTPVPDGRYVIRAIVDPDNLLWESPGKADPARESQIANQGVASLDLVNGVITWNG
jgi:hypothetical protein